MKNLISNLIIAASLVLSVERIFCQNISPVDTLKYMDYSLSDRETDRMNLMADNYKKFVTNSTLITDEKTAYTFEELSNLERQKRLESLNILTQKEQIAKYTSNENIAFVILVSVKKKE